MFKSPNLPTLLLVVVALGTMIPSVLPGAETIPHAPPASSAEAGDVDKFLFILSTSNEMEDMEHGGRQTLFDLIHSGISEYMRLGDTFGVWSFNSRLNAGQYPMQTWDPSNTVNLATQASLFIKDQNYRGRSNLDAVMEGVKHLMQSVRDVNILIIADSKARLHGTPFDDALNKVYQERGSESRREKKPFITTMLVRGGVMTRAGVTLDGEPIAWPVRPPPPEPQVVELPKIPVTSPPVVRPWKAGAKEEIIVSKSGTVTKLSESGILISGPNPGAPLPVSTPDLDRLQVDPSVVISPEYERAIPDPGPLAPPTRAAVEAVPAEPFFDPLAASDEVAAATAPPLSTPSMPAPEPSAAPVPELSPQASGIVAPAAPGTAQTSLPVAPADSPPSDSAAIKTDESSLASRLAPVPLLVSARERYDVQPAADRLGLNSTPLTALVTPAEQGSSPAFWFYAAGAGLLLVGMVGMVYWLAQRRSGTAQASFITKSMHRK